MRQRRAGVERGEPEGRRARPEERPATSRSRARRTGGPTSWADWSTSCCLGKAGEGSASDEPESSEENRRADERDRKKRSASDEPESSEENRRADERDRKNGQRRAGVERGEPEGRRAGPTGARRVAWAKPARKAPATSRSRARRTGGPTSETGRRGAPAT